MGLMTARLRQAENRALRLSLSAMLLGNLALDVLNSIKRSLFLDLRSAMWRGRALFTLRYTTRMRPPPQSNSRVSARGN
jgi:hypothetical protein